MDNARPPLPAARTIAELDPRLRGKGQHGVERLAVYRGAWR